MKKVLFVFAIAASLVACDNSGNSTGDKKDSLDSVAGAKKEMVDSSADARKDIIDSTTNKQKETVEKMDSMTHKTDSAAHH